MTWGVWWHEGSARVYANRAESSPCELGIAADETRLVGSFSCHGRVNEDGSAAVDLLEGCFELLLDPATYTARLPTVTPR
jgi:hypothetical protein